MNAKRLSTNFSLYQHLFTEDSTIINSKIEQFLAKGQIWMYDKGVLVNGSPFNNFKEIIKVKGFSQRSKPYLSKLKDTGKQYKYRFTFFSKPLNTPPPSFNFLGQGTRDKG